MHLFAVIGHPSSHVISFHGLSGTGACYRRQWHWHGAFEVAGESLSLSLSLSLFGFCN